MTNQTGTTKTNILTNILLGVIAVLLVALIVLFATNQASNAIQNSTDVSKREALITKITQVSQENQAAIDDLFKDYTRDRGYHTEFEGDYLLKQGIVGDEYIIHGMMFLAKQNNQLLELLAEMQ